MYKVSELPSALADLKFNIGEASKDDVVLSTLAGSNREAFENRGYEVDTTFSPTTWACAGVKDSDTSYIGNAVYLTRTMYKDKPIVIYIGVSFQGNTKFEHVIASISGIRADNMKSLTRKMFTPEVLADCQRLIGEVLDNLTYYTSDKYSFDLVWCNEGV